MLNALVGLVVVLNRILVVSAASFDSISCEYQKCPTLDDKRINVHIIPHSHNDVGWLKTIDQYYYGSQNDIQFAGVQYIITSVLEALRANPQRKFIQVETAFFWKWWNLQREDFKRFYVDLVNNGQIEMVNGGWTMNDEAGTYYQAIIDQFTWGLRKLNETVGICGRPKVGWQIDSRGHSKEQASLFKQFGFDALFLDHIDFRDKDKRKLGKRLNFLWKSSETLDDSTIFTSMFPDHYSSVGGLGFDITGSDSPVIDDPDSPDYNLGDKISTLLSHLDEFSLYYKSKNILLPFGGDFHFQAAETNFLNMDKIIKMLESHDDYKIFYSLPSCYVKAVNSEIQQKSELMALKTDDFFPSASNIHSFWTGYFTSRPSLKRLERIGNNVLQCVKQLSTVSRIFSIDIEEFVTPLREVVALLQHHNAITGTERQTVTRNYVKLIVKAIHGAVKPMGIVLGKLLKNKPTLPDLSLQFSICLLSNVSICDVTKSDRFLVAVYNPLARIVNHYVRLPIPQGAYIITGPDGVEVNDVLDTLHTFSYIPEASPSPKDMVFLAKNLPPMGIKLYHVEKSQISPTSAISPQNFEDIFFGNEKNGFTIDQQTKLLKSIRINGQNLEITQEFLYYETYTVSNQNLQGSLNQSSGAYVFRPLDIIPKPMARAPITIKIKRGNLVDEVKQVISEEVRQIIRVYKHANDSYIEFDWLVGNLQVDGQTFSGKEVITRFTVKNFLNKGIFYTDSNGRQMVKRELNKRSDYDYDPTEEPVASNYYPVASRIVIKDEDQQLEVAVITDRPQGGASLNEGTIELMIHRRIQTDDGVGLGEPLNEIEFDRGLYVRGQHWLTFGSSSSVGGNERTTVDREKELVMQKLLSPLVLLADATDEEFDLENLLNHLQFKFDGLTKPLPNNIHLLTLEPWRDDTALLRLEHIFEKNEDAALSKYTEVDLKDIFTSFDLKEIKETTLGANEWWAEYQNKDKMIWTNDTQEKRYETKTVLLDSSLNPMQIRTFVARMISKANNTDFDDTDTQDGKANNFDGLTKPLPNNIHLLTLEPWRDDTALLRLEHIFEKNEDAALSKYTEVDLKDIFTSFDLKEIKETTLGANEWWAEYQNKDKMIWTNDTQEKRYETKTVLLDSSLNPMQIRTFVARMISKANNTDFDDTDTQDGKANNVFLQQILLIIVFCINLTVL